ncbi:hypothetical protein [Paenibacillus arenosi]|uniref:PepSY domain-containing protein n=1 Tax=Paenibacillus arenosi TaxID=2774142 RepID=A0ABR9AWX0_9BACL|nr:hypothetical protein [Paenibacillus arenosi]MBD8498631.1 hypothetical protein [Paenibacillus arenosi]
MKKNRKKTSVRLAALGLATVISLSGALVVSANENENPTQKTVAQNNELYAGTYKKVSASEALADKDVKAKIDQVYAQFPETKSYEIDAYEDVVSKSDSEYDKYVIRLEEKDGANFFHFAVDSKTGNFSYTIQSLDASTVLSYPNVKSGVDKIHVSLPELKSYEISSAYVIDNFASNFSRYNLTFTKKNTGHSITIGIDGKTGDIIPEK